jgi:peroxin-10
MTNESEDSGGNSRSTSHSVARWIVRLHLAHFLLTGKYPTLMHRFLGLQPGRESSGKDATRGTEPTTAILDRPTTNRAIALFILLQASTSLVQNTSNWLAEKVAKHLQARASARRRLRRQQSNAPLTKAQLRNKLDRFFGNDTSEDQEKHNLGNPTLDSSTNTTSKRDDKETTILCTICRLERKHPAAPSSCGHVCCWNCLIQWVSTVRPECPICRAPCSAKDILPLHHYEPVL